MSCWPASRGPHGQVFVGWKSTLIRLELVGRTGRYHKIGNSAESLDRLLMNLFLESHTTRPEQIVLDLDATDITLYGHQLERCLRTQYIPIRYRQQATTASVISSAIATPPTTAEAASWAHGVLPTTR